MHSVFVPALCCSNIVSILNIASIKKLPKLGYKNYESWNCAIKKKPNRETYSTWNLVTIVDVFSLFLIRFFLYLVAVLVGSSDKDNVFMLAFLNKFDNNWLISGFIYLEFVFFLL